jgi:hypothetical protein
MISRAVSRQRRAALRRHAARLERYSTSSVSIGRPASTQPR